MKRKASTGANTPRKKPRLERQNATVGDVVSLQRQVNSLKAETETKVQEWNLTGNLAISGAYATAESCINRVTQNPGYFERIGNKITVSGIYLKYFIRSRTAELTEATNVRVLVFIDKNPSSGIVTCPALNSLYPPNGVLANGGTTLVHANTFWPSRKRYKILYDKVVTVNPDTVLDYDPVTGNTTAMFPKTAERKKFIPLSDLPILYNNTTNTVDAIASNAIWVWFGQTVTGSAVGATVDMTARIYFKDA